MIQLNQLVKKFDTLVAVDHLSMEVEQGEFFVVLGPNAAGKTTTIKILTGLMKPTSGSVRVAGFDLRDHSLEARKRMAYIPDFPFLYDKLTPAEFLRFTGELFQMPPRRVALALEELARTFNLTGFLNQSIEGLSHGTRQRLAFAAALLHDPEVLIIDEPMVGLDPQHARIVKDVLKARAENGMTVFMSTHQLSVAEEMADRIGIMQYGKLIACGTPAELRTSGGKESPLEKAFLALTQETGLRVPDEETTV